WPRSSRTAVVPARTRYEAPDDPGRSDHAGPAPSTTSSYGGPSGDIAPAYGMARPGRRPARTDRLAVIRAACARAGPEGRGWPAEPVVRVSAWGSWRACLPC